VHEQETAKVDATSGSLPGSAARSGPWDVSSTGRPRCQRRPPPRRSRSSLPTSLATRTTPPTTATFPGREDRDAASFCGDGSACSNVKVRVDSIAGSRFYTLQGFSLENSQSTPVHVCEDPGEQVAVSLLNDNSGPAGNVAVAVPSRAN
jgi:hypothetical protein